MPDEWISTSDAAELLNVSERHVRNMAAKGKVKARKKGRIWLIHRSLPGPELEQIGTDTGEKEQQASDEDIAWFKQRIEEQSRHISELQSELKRKDEQSEQARERTDMIIMQLTRQLDQSQKLLENQSTKRRKLTFWRRRVFGRDEE